MHGQQNIKLLASFVENTISEILDRYFLTEVLGDLSIL
jgi:hypothetical protein